MTVFAELAGVAALVPGAIRIARNVGERDEVRHLARLGLRNTLLERGNLLSFGVPGSRWLDVAVATCCSDSSSSSSSSSSRKLDSRAIHRPVGISASGEKIRTVSRCKPFSQHSPKFVAPQVPLRIVPTGGGGAKSGVPCMMPT